jgi:multidrug resistance efflux pump
MTWEALSSRFTLGLEQHEQTLKELGQKLQTSEASLQRLMPLYELSLQQNESLKTFNSQIGQRMQESDEWNAELQDENVKLEAKVNVARANGLRNTIIAGVGGIVLGLIIPIILKLLRTFKIIP